ncbi:MAG TPA: DUF6265 family protein [Flavipsychrobacter sp.]|nr:DUF6265 family protein [Flavipsychrobacter sp.]
MKKPLFIAVISCIFLQACSTGKNESTKLDRIDWVLGYWEMSSPQGTVTESWIRTNDTVFSGIGKFMDSSGKMLTTEEIIIVLRNGELLYIPTVSEQNNGQPVIFRETSFSDTMIAFENKGHDFPQRIVYVKQNEGSMLAYIEGEVNGEQMKIEYPYTKH